MSGLRNLFRGLFLSFASVLITLAVMEAALRLFVHVTDDVEYQDLPGVGCALRPGQSGRFIRSGGIDAQFRVNAEGWNAPREYTKQRVPGRLRIAVVGDSFVEGMYVEQEQLLSSVLERGLRKDGIDAEVYSFGVSGYGASQVLHLVQRYVLDYSPDLIVYLFIRNDASDSCRCMEDKRWTQQYALGPDGALEALPFKRYHMSMTKRALRKSALVRFFLYQRRLLERFRDSSKQAAAETSASPEGCRQDCWRIVGLLLQELQGTLEAKHVPWLLAWEGDANPDYARDERGRLEEIASTSGLPYRDLSPSFAAAARAGFRRYRYPGDGHWNAEGNRIAGEALVPMVRALLEKP
ncbi:MAG TPA: SGNH/GDSL hydrolase family protein [Candidatus Polarisedimenticolia bacterium]|nr:SGNH/GDSL hydrolase family protein [Candidatus Polarisedimenticolia bacterium]